VNTVVPVFQRRHGGTPSYPDRPGNCGATQQSPPPTSPTLYPESHPATPANVTQGKQGIWGLRWRSCLQFQIYTYCCENGNFRVVLGSCPNAIVWDLCCLKFARLLSYTITFFGLCIKFRWLFRLWIHATVSVCSPEVRLVTMKNSAFTASNDIN